MSESENDAPRDVRFDPAKVPASEVLKRLVAAALDRLGAVDNRRRRRRSTDARNYDETVSALIANLVHREMSEPSGWLMVPLAKAALAAKVRPAPFMTEAFANTIKLLHRAGIVELEIGVATQLGKLQSTVRAGPWLLERVDEMELDFGHIGRDPRLLGDPLLLRSRKVNGKAVSLPLPNTAEVRQLCQQMDAINERIAKADLRMSDDWDDELVDTGMRHLVRIFNDGSLERGGRLFGGFWLNPPMNAYNRLAYLRINGQPIASLDFCQMSVRIAYSKAGVVAPEGDLYNVPGLPRDGVKRVINAELAKGSESNRFPKGTKTHFPGMTFAEVRAAICNHYPDLAKEFGRSQALVHQHVESNVIVRSLLALMDMGVVALPVHDSLLVPVSEAPIAKYVMENTFLELTGVKGQVREQVMERASQQGMSLTTSVSDGAAENPEESSGRA